MDSQWVTMGLLILVVLFSLANLGGLALLWVHIDRRGSDIRGLDRRVTQLEARDSVGLTPKEIREMHDRLADIDARLEVTEGRAERIEKFLMEKP